MSFIRSFLSVSGLTLVSRVLGLVRDVIVAAVFGAGAVTDAFFTAFRLPNTLRRFTAEGALTQAFVPVYRQRHQQSPEAAGQVAGEAAAFLFVVLLVFSVACLFFAPWIVYVLAPGLPERATAADLLRIVFPYLLFISLASLATGMLNAVGRFFAAAAIPVFLNLSMIGAALILAPHFDRPIFALAWGGFSWRACAVAVGRFFRLARAAASRAVAVALSSVGGGEARFAPVGLWRDGRRRGAD